MSDDKQGQPQPLREEFTKDAKRIDVVESIRVREERAREAMIVNAQLRILREKLGACRKREGGANVYVACEKYARAYYSMMRLPQEQASEKGPVELSDIE